MARAQRGYDIRNVGGKERWVRLAIGAAAIPALLKIRSTPLRILLGAVAVSAITTASTRYCRFNELMGRRAA